jgi:hypothetical protein
MTSEDDCTTSFDECVDVVIFWDCLRSLLVTYERALIVRSVKESSLTERPL